MNLLAFMKKKGDKIYNQLRCDTQAGPKLPKKQKTLKQDKQDDKQSQRKYKLNTESHGNNHPVPQFKYTTLKQTPKYELNIKQILESLWKMKVAFEYEYDIILANTAPTELSLHLITSDFFRYMFTNTEVLKESYSELIQAIELLVSKLQNNERLDDKIYIKNQEDFVLFFKFFFSKPYTLVNRLPVRKLIKTIWDRQFFHSFNITKQIEHLRLWVHGIAMPLNPAMNRLHQVVIERPHQVTLYVKHSHKDCIYIGINDADALGLTPLMVAAIVKSKVAIEKLVKNGCSLYCCPLTLNKNNSIDTFQSTKYKKYLFTRQNGQQERRQYDPLQILRNSKHYDLIADCFYFSAISRVKRLKSSKLSDSLATFPNCSFQIDWRQFKGLLCFKQLPHDVISIYKKNYHLRLDYHIDSLDTPKSHRQKPQLPHISLIISAEPQCEPQLYLIKHHKKQMIDLRKQIDLEQLKAQYENYMNYGNIYNERVMGYKGMYAPKENKLSISIDTGYENVQKAEMSPFTTVNEYLRLIMDSEMLDYSRLEKSQIDSVYRQNCLKNLSKTKNKITKSNQSLEIQFIDSQLKLKHLCIIFQMAAFLYPSSVLIHKINKIVEIFHDRFSQSLQLQQKLPKKILFSTGDSLNIQCQLKNLLYTSVNDDVFSLQIRVREMHYDEQQDIDLSKLQQTLLMDEIHSISSSRFLGKSEKMLDLEQKQANGQWEALMKREALEDDDQKDNSAQSESRQSPKRVI